MSTPVPKTLHAWLLTDPLAPVHLGEIKAVAVGGSVSFQYSTQWIGSGFALSDDLPLQGVLYVPPARDDRSSCAPGAIDDARPDNWGEKVIRYLHKPVGNRLLANLFLSGDDRFGAIGISSSADSYQPFSKSALPRLQDAKELSDVAKIIMQGDGELNEQRRKLTPSIASLGGAKPKAVIQIGDDQWVLKFFNAEPVDLPLVEHASMTLAAKAGINVATTQVVPLKLIENALAIKRFDREGGRRLHCISAGTALRASAPSGSQPVFGYAALAQLLRANASVKTVDDQLLDLFKRMVFNILIGNTDDHEKNHSLIVRTHGKTVDIELSPAYDILPTNSGDTDHQFLISYDSAEPTLANALSICSEFDLEPKKAAKEIASLIQVVGNWQMHFKDAGVTDSDIEELRGWIDTEFLLNERKSFSKSNPRPTI